MSAAVTTTCQITFGAGDKNRAHLSAEVDSRPNGLNGGRTRFTGGEPVYTLVYKSKNVTIQQSAVSAGAVFPAENVLVDMDEFITFANKREASLSKPATGPLSVTWYGRSLGGLSLQEDQTTVLASMEGVAVARVRYKAQARAWRLSTPTELNGEKEFNILFFVAGMAA